MGKIEGNVRKSIRRTKINKAVISVIATAGVLAVGLVAPNVLGAMKKLGILEVGRKKQNIQKSITRLIRSGYVIVENGKAHLTEKGETLATLIDEGKVRTRNQSRWDGKWRVLIFDIAERRRTLRRHVRQVLLSLGFVRLQDSVWVFPYDCEDIITMFKIDQHIGKDMLYMVVDVIENDRHLRRAFGLSAES